MRIRTKKSFGQHLLTNDEVIDGIVEAFSSKLKHDQFMEVGAGRGALTSKLLTIRKKMVAVEAEEEMYKWLANQFSKSPYIDIIFEDFLKIDIIQIMNDKDFGLIGNFPYNLSTQIIFKMLDCRKSIPLCVGMFQKEVAERIASSHGTKVYGILSVLCQVYYEVEYLFTVEPEEFYPPPKVQSGVLRMTRRETPLTDASFSMLKRVVKSIFNQRRKMLSNSLRSSFDDLSFLPKTLLRLRPEQLSVTDFAHLAKLMEQHSE